MALSIRHWERFWVVHHRFILEKGYRLPERYDPDWVPSWFRRKYNSGNINQMELDGVVLDNPKLLNAIRIRDGKKVVLKRVSVDIDVPILEFLHSPEFAADPRNNTVPLLDVIYLPDDENTALIVIPLLLHFNALAAPFRFVSEFVEAIDQFLQGLSFYHENYIAHRDACYLNLMMDPSNIVPGGFNFSYPSWQEDLQKMAKYRDRRSVRPVKYYFIDFETALILPPETYGDDPQFFGMIGQDKTAPEWSTPDQAYNPFKLDVYQLGGDILKVVERYDGLESFLPLCTSMMKKNPYERLTAAEACKNFQDMVSAMTIQDLDSRVGPKKLGAKQRRLIASKSEGLLKRFWVPIYEFFQEDD
ncbi:hypothetical protein D9613_010146 [Agrocybe pediades]|uniref:Protein kinase domain-containing protein n=1 Tax=Agrocybe pediades TaxID=84607 RepID=A0A8H4VQ15_9AGAR|nr:hypothetical protein D9613_010146 [Agrocybe pediades]